MNRIAWLNENGEEVTSSESVPQQNLQLTLTLNSVTELMNGAQFTCQTESEFGNQTRMIVLVVGEAATMESATATSTDAATETETAMAEEGFFDSIIAIVVVAAGGFSVLLLIPASVTIVVLCIRQSTR